MQATATTGDFLALIRKSGLLPPAELKTYMAELSNPHEMSPEDLAARMVADAKLTQFQAHHLLKGRYKNFFIGKFKVMQPLGRGGMSQVFLCEHTVMKHLVALKLLPIKDSSDGESVGRFLREARAAAAVNHPNVVRAHDVDKAEGKIYYLVMDYIDGVNLHDLVKRIGPLPPEQAANYIAQAAIGLQEIAQKGLIHRDLKPSNFILDREGVVRILDLGLARFTDDSNDNVTQRFHSDSVFGTADYLAPEQALQMPDVDPRADIYSLGATLYFLLSGTAPFESASVTQKLLAHQMRDADAIENVPKELMAVIRRMMQKKPEGRYQCAMDVVEALTPWASLRLPLPPDDFFPNMVSDGGPATNGPRSAPPSTAGLGKTLASTRGYAVNRFAPGPTSDILRAGPSGPPAGPSSQSFLESPKRNRRVMYAGLACGVVGLLVGGLVAGGVFDGKPAEIVNAGDGPPPQTESEKLVVPPPAGSLMVGPGGAYRTVAEALAKAKPGSRIVVTGDEHVETLTLSKLPKNVTIQGWPETKQVVWKSAMADQPLLKIADCDSLTVSNFAFNGAGKTPSLIEVRGACPNLVLTQSSAANFAKRAVLLSGCQGLVTLSRLRIVEKGAAGVALVREGDTPCRDVVIEHCRFEGSLDPAIDLGADADATVSGCRFHQNTAAIEVDESPAADGVRILNNSFAECGVGLKLNKLPASPDLVSFKNNLFFKCGFAISYEPLKGAKLDVPEAVWFWHDEGLEAAKATNTPEGTRFFRRTFTVTTPLADAILDVGGVTSFKVWVNGTLVGESDPKHFTKRVYAFDVSRLLHAGVNAIAIEARHTKDPIDPGFAVAGGVTARLTARDGVAMPANDAWLSSDTEAPGWTAADFNATGWKPVRPWTAPGYIFPWANSVWDSEAGRLKLGNPGSAIAADGNVRDYATQESFPLTNSKRGVIPALAGLNPDDDATFLRTPRQPVRLHTAGVGGAPVGVVNGR